MFTIINIHVHYSYIIWLFYSKVLLNLGNEIKTNIVGINGVLILIMKVVITIINQTKVPNSTLQKKKWQMYNVVHLFKYILLC